MRTVFARRALISLPCIVVVLASIVASELPAQNLSVSQDEHLRPASVANSIEMTVVGSKIANYWDVPPATFSPDGKQFVVVTRRGNIEQNTNDFSLLLFRTKDVFRAPKPKTLITFASSSNNPGIDALRWLPDNETVVFLGEQAGQHQQLYSFNVLTNALKPIVAHATDIVAFDATPDLQTIVYLARPPITNIFDDKARRSGLVVSHQLHTDLMTGHTSDVSNDFLFSPNPYEVVVVRRGDEPRRIALGTDLPVSESRPFVSPDGRYTIMRPFVGAFPDTWRDYRDQWIHSALFQGAGELYRYLLIDNVKGIARALIDAPSTLTTIDDEVAWSRDGQFAIVTGTFLPLDVTDAAERAARETKPYAVEVNIGTGQIKKIAEGNFDLVKWESSTETLVLRPHVAFDSRSDQMLAFRRSKGRWQKIDPQAVDTKSKNDIEISEEQDMNTPPRLVAANRQTQEKATLLDLNPQFRDLKFGKVESITWKGSDGHDAKGGLYFPVNYVPGQRYPLVVQTHGWNPRKFWIDGVSAAGYGAQELAGKGFVVAQVADNFVEDDMESPREGQQQMAMFEGLIDCLDQRALIDRSHVGITGWSRTGYGVRYTLTFSKYHFAAAAIVDGMDASYFQYVAWLPADDLRKAAGNFYEQVNGGNPFVNGWDSWLTHATAFNLDKVHTPVRIVGFRPYSLDGAWEWFAGLHHLGRPVELIWLPDAAHDPVRPSERVTAQQGDVDWFCFWLKGEEDPDPAKAEQYLRWRELRKQQEKSEAEIRQGAQVH